MEKLVILLALAYGLMSCGKIPDDFQVQSPDGQIELELSLVDSKLQYQIDRNEQEVMGTSDLEIFPGSEVVILNVT